MKQTQLIFQYRNGKGYDHLYRMHPESNLTFECLPHETEFSWNLSGFVFERDGEARPGRRTFILTRMKNISEVTG